MNRRLLAFALAAVAVGGTATAVFPQHAWSIARLAAVSVVVLAGALVLAAVAALGSPDPEPGALDRLPSGPVTPLDPHGLRDARRDLTRPRRSGSVPRPVWARLRHAALVSLRDAGYDIDDRAAAARVRRALSEETWNVLSTQPAVGGTTDAAASAAVVHAVLDELDRLSTGARP